MYTNIPINETLQIIEQQLQLLQNHTLEIKKLLKLLQITLKLFPISRLLLWSK